MSKVIGLYIYPVKSCGAVELNSLKIDDYGPIWDRNWMLVDTNGKFISQREVPQLCQVKVKALSLENGEFELSYKDKPKLKLSPSSSSESLSVSVWAWDLKAIKCNDEVNNWFSDVVGKPVFLVENSKEITQRKIKEKYGDSHFKFADGLPLLLIGSASLDLLNDKLKEKISIKNFRTNIYVETAKAHIEDEWGTIKINNLSFDLVKRCARCVMININQDTGHVNPEALRTLAKYRKGDKGIEFGQNLVHKGLGVINLGDEINV